MEQALIHVGGQLLGEELGNSGSSTNSYQVTPQELEGMLNNLEVITLKKINTK